MRKKFKTQEQKTSRFQLRVSAAHQDSRDLSTNDAIRRRAVLRCEVSALEAEQIELTTRQAKLRARRQELEAQILGITVSIERR